ncbi:neuropeptide CCHamide-2 receptor-like isoform X2 [Episyrphus balteatus]|uniref:neuropeptide CCHamide-2 receptor-like isoform X2 n=1 Tax=Episyrphus balteatus TaxID=286459 RepID=UPI0024855859|nr:neuropeptide CCHamide-2 receptor-like isoform X2 [Episyrphus balteatus]
MVGGNQTAIFLEMFANEETPRDEIFKSDWFKNNVSQLFNISEKNLTNLLDNYIELDGNAERDSIALLSVITVCYALIFIAGILGNLITCIVINRNKFMHTATNFYLFNLAVSDLILLLSGMPNELYSMWYPTSYPFTDVVCIIGGILSETAANATVLTITAFTVERYIAICHPFRQHTMSKLSRAIKFILAIWVAAFLLALPQAMQFSVMKQNDTKVCSVKNDLTQDVFVVSGFIFFGGPMTAICVLYVLIGVKLKRSRMLQAVPRRCFDLNRGISAQTRVIRMLIAVAVAFFLCWAPHHAQRLMAVYGSSIGDTSPLYNEIYSILTYISGVIYFLSTCINPLLYNIMSHKFRDAFKVTLARHFGLTGRYQTTNHNYSALLRQNGSMRLHTTDSVRTNGNSCRAHRMRCVSVSSQSTLMTSLSKNDVFATNSYVLQSATAVAAAAVNSTPKMAGVPTHRGELHTQISQVSSLDDANSLLESEIAHNHHHQSSYRLKEMRRPQGYLPAQLVSSDELSLDSGEWTDNNLDMSNRCSDNETDVFPKSGIERAGTPLRVQELRCHPGGGIHYNGSVSTTRRPKLSSIIRRDPHSTNSRVELRNSSRKPASKTLESLSDKIRWRTRRKMNFLRGTGSNKNPSIKESNSSVSLPVSPVKPIANSTVKVHVGLHEITTNGNGEYNSVS